MSTLGFAKGFLAGYLGGTFCTREQLSYVLGSIVVPEGAEVSAGSTHILPPCLDGSSVEYFGSVYHRHSWGMGPRSFQPPAALPLLCLSLSHHTVASSLGAAVLIPLSNLSTLYLLRAPQS